MPKVEIIENNKYRYRCGCGALVTLQSDTTPERLIKCFDCQISIEGLKRDLEIIEILKNIEGV
jgi:hypothetical protein